MTWADRQGFDAARIWRDLEDVLHRGQPLPDEARRYLLDVALRVNTRVHAATPELAARSMAEALGLTGRAIREHRKREKAKLVDGLFQRGADCKSENLAEDIGQLLGLGERQVYRIKRSY